MHVEARRDEKNVGPEIVELRRGVFIESFAERVAVAAFGQGKVEDVVPRACFIRKTGEGAFFVQGDVQPVFEIPEKALRTVAVMRVEIKNGDFADIHSLLRGDGGEGDVIEKAKTYGGVGFGVVPPRADKAKGFVDFSRCDFGCCGEGRCRGGKRRFGCAAHGAGVFVEEAFLAFFYGGEDVVDIGGRVEEG